MLLLDYINPRDYINLSNMNGVTIEVTKHKIYSYTNLIRQFIFTKMNSMKYIYFFDIILFFRSFKYHLKLVAASLELSRL